MSKIFEIDQEQRTVSRSSERLFRTEHRPDVARE